MLCSFSTIWCKIFNSNIWFSYMILNFFVLTMGTFSLREHHDVHLVCNFTDPCISGLWTPWISFNTPSKFPQKRFLKVLFITFLKKCKGAGKPLVPLFPPVELLLEIWSLNEPRWSIWKNVLRSRQYCRREFHTCAQTSHPGSFARKPIPYML